MYINVGADPGMQTKVEAVPVQITWGHENLAIRDSLPRILSSSTDAGNSPTTTLRGGLVMAKNSDDIWVPYDADAGDTTAEARGILGATVNMLNSSGTAIAKNQSIIVAGPVMASKCLNLDRAARHRLTMQGMLFDDQFVYSGSPGLSFGLGARNVINAAASVALTAAQTNTKFLCTAASDFTLPTKALGLVYEFYQLADANLVVTGSNDIIVDGDLAASTVTFSTASHKIGAHVRVECVYTAASTLRWIASILCQNAATIA